MHVAYMFQASTSTKDSHEPRTSDPVADLQVTRHFNSPVLRESPLNSSEKQGHQPTVRKISTVVG
jgi:hypothetical protein